MAKKDKSLSPAGSPPELNNPFAGLQIPGLPPGPAYQVILSRLRVAWLDGELKTNEEELTLLDKLTKLV